MSRSGHWPEVARLVDRSQQDAEEFDPETGDPERCLSAGVEPIVELYIDVRKTDGERLTPVEQSLLERALNDWLSLYAACHDAPFHAHFTVHEMAVAYAGNGDLRSTVGELLDV
ncbi:hypothetical protein SAMN04487949_2664 [Halogranum gelatinilyticum]|uniref:DUF8055 domain-containing protein n=1 Tax=Halogranum gelatinilyticum TaxID=660521 RepID=A0A1G9W9W5_9EURY|nr:hypothetical protein [Halogranum gelatinilyticum]SDM81006.1 hypothetical protein SAMN04487949_2664 [Halogranum gelatinilyticum]